MREAASIVRALVVAVAALAALAMPPCLASSGGSHWLWKYDMPSCSTGSLTLRRSGAPHVPSGVRKRTTLV